MICNKSSPQSVSESSVKSSVSKFRVAQIHQISIRTLSAAPNSNNVGVDHLVAGEPDLSSRGHHSKAINTIYNSVNSFVHRANKSITCLIGTFYCCYKYIIMARITFYIYIQIYVAVTLLKLIFNF